MFVNFHRRALKYCCFLDRQRKCIVNWLYWYTPEIVSSISTVHSGISDSSCWLYISQHLPWWTQICCASSWLRWKDHYSLVYRKFTWNLCVVIGNIITVWTVNTKLLLTEREGPKGQYLPEVVAVRTERSDQVYDMKKYTAHDFFHRNGP